MNQLTSNAAYRTWHVTNSNFSLRKFAKSTCGQGCSTSGLMMAMNGILNNLPKFSHRWPRIEHIWPSVGSVELTWPSVRCNSVSLRAKRKNQLHGGLLKKYFLYPILAQSKFDAAAMFGETRKHCFRRGTGSNPSRFR